MLERDNKTAAFVPSRFPGKGWGIGPGDIEVVMVMIMECIVYYLSSQWSSHGAKHVISFDPYISIETNNGHPHFTDEETEN